MKNWLTSTGGKLLIGALRRVLIMGRFDKLSKNLLVDDVIKIRPDPTWCLENKPVYDDAKRDAEIANCDHHMFA